jgi:predicted negative regulator of RcsB-dependent stress response
VSQVTGRGVRATLLAQEGQIDAAVAMAEEAAALTAGIDFWETLMFAFECLGDVYATAGRRDAAAGAFGRALDVCQRKGAVPAVKQISRKLASVGT